MHSEPRATDQNQDQKQQSRQGTATRACANYAEQFLFYVFFPLVVSSKTMPATMALRLVHSRLLSSLPIPRKFSWPTAPETYCQVTCTPEGTTTLVPFSKKEPRARPQKGTQIGEQSTATRASANSAAFLFPFPN